MKCIFLAAGYATRLYPLTENFPKPLLTIGSETIVDRLIADLEESKAVNEYICVTNHRFAHIFEDWAGHRSENITILDDGTQTNEERLGAVRDILFAVNEKAIREDVLVMAGDNALDFSLKGFIAYARKKNTSCVMCHEENELKKQQKTAIITRDEQGLITSYEEKPRVPQGNLAVPPFYYYKAQDLALLEKALSSGCGADAPGSFAAWLSTQVPMHAWLMPGRRFDIGDIESYRAVQAYFGRSRQ